MPRSLITEVARTTYTRGLMARRVERHDQGAPVSNGRANCDLLGLLATCFVRPARPVMGVSKLTAPGRETRSKFLQYDTTSSLGNF